MSSVLLGILGRLLVPSNEGSKAASMKGLMGTSLALSVALVAMPVLIWVPAAQNAGNEGPPILTCRAPPLPPGGRSLDTELEHFFRTGEELLMRFYAMRTCGCAARVRLCAEGEGPLDLYFGRVAPALTALSVASAVWCLLARLYYRCLERTALREEEEEEEEEEEGGKDSFASDGGEGRNLLRLLVEILVPSCCEDQDQRGGGDS